MEREILEHQYREQRAEDRKRLMEELKEIYLKKLEESRLFSEVMLSALIDMITLVIQMQNDHPRPILRLFVMYVLQCTRRMWYLLQRGL
jgi:hypothetical protein